MLGETSSSFISWEDPSFKDQLTPFLWIPCLLNNLWILWLPIIREYVVLNI
jgi:hypothetical protein